jgi:hypothetical protein
VLIHFPLALFVAGVVFDFLAQKTKKHGLLEAAYYKLLGAAIFALPAVVMGILAWQFQLQGQKLKGILLMHFWCWVRRRQSSSGWPGHCMCVPDDSFLWGFRFFVWGGKRQPWR